MSRFSKNKKEAKTEKQKVEERREEVLANGRKFKYPLQYAKHKLVFNTIIISVVAIGILVAALWAMLYKFQNTGDVVYRISKVLPVPVAEVDGEKVRFSDYLMISQSITALYISHIHAETQGRPLFIVDKRESRNISEDKQD